MRCFVLGVAVFVAPLALVAAVAVSSHASANNKPEVSHQLSAGDGVYHPASQQPVEAEVWNHREGARQTQTRVFRIVDQDTGVVCYVVPSALQHGTVEYQPAISCVLVRR